MGELFREAQAAMKELNTMAGKQDRQGKKGTDVRDRALAILGERSLRQDTPWLEEDGWDEIPDGWEIDPKGTGRLVRARPKWKGDEIKVPGFETLSGEYTIYFAYGSNLHMEQMARRCPTAIPLGKAILPGWSLRWNGVLTIVETGNRDVWGALWATKEGDEHSLDRYEGCDRECGPGGLYRKERITVYDDHGNAWRPYVYIMNRGRESYPAPSYLQTCVTGAVQFGIPAAYLMNTLPRR